MHPRTHLRALSFYDAQESPSWPRGEPNPLLLGMVRPSGLAASVAEAFVGILHRPL